MSGPTAVLDTDVLVPIIACDFLLTAFDHGLYEPIVSTAALAEIERTLIEDFPHLDSAAIQHRVATMQVALEDQLVDGQAVDVPAGINPKDRHVVGAALVAAAPVIVSNDRRLRGEVDASGLQLAALDLDTFAIGLWRSSPTDVHAVIDTMVSKRQRPPISTVELMGAIHRYMPSRPWPFRRAEPDVLTLRSPDISSLVGAVVDVAVEGWRLGRRRLLWSGVADVLRVAVDRRRTLSVEHQFAPWREPCGCSGW